MTFIIVSPAETSLSLTPPRQVFWRSTVWTRDTFVCGRAGKSGRSLAPLTDTRKHASIGAHMKRRCGSDEWRLRRHHCPRNERRYSTFVCSARRSHLNCSQERGIPVTIPDPMEVDPILSDLDVRMPGTYIEEHLLDQPPASTTNTAAASMEPRRTRRAPARFRDILPEPPRAVPAPAPQPRLPTVYLIVTNPFETIFNSFGLFRRYLFHPSHDPDAFVNPSDLSNLTAHTPSTPPPRSIETNCDSPQPFANMSVWRLMRWMNTGSNSKSEGEVNRLVDDVLSAPDFRTEDLRNFNAHRENSCLDTADKSTPLEDNFQAASITIEVPTGQPNDPSTPRTYSVPGLRYRKLLNVVKAAFQDPLSQQFHFTPFSLMHKSPITGEPQRVYGELYNSDEFINEHKRVQNCSLPPPDDPECKLEKVIAALMFWSDSTHLTNFGTAALWPIYLFFGNLSKYIRSRPSSGACHHLAYIPSVFIPSICAAFSDSCSIAP